MKRMKKFVAGAVLAAMLTTTVSVFAEWEFAGYNTTQGELGIYSKVYNEVIDGKYTTKSKLETVAPEDVEWRFEGYEKAYPHAGYERLYLEGNRQEKITRTVALFPQWETRFKDFVWELHGEHSIYARQQTKINNSYWAWDFAQPGTEDEALIFVDTNRDQKVDVSRKDYSIANLDMNGNYIFDVTGKVYNQKKYDTLKNFSMPQPFDVEVVNGEPTKGFAAGHQLHYATLSQRSEDGQYVYGDAYLADYIANVYGVKESKVLTGPDYLVGGTVTKDVAAIYEDATNKDAWEWDYDVVRSTWDVQVSWTKPTFESAWPYKYYQYMVVNGLVMDGRNDTPVIFRYTGGKASPKVEWRYFTVEADTAAFADFAGVDLGNFPQHQVFEIQFLQDAQGNMIPALDENGKPYIRKATGEFGQGYWVVTDTEIQYWIQDKAGDHQVVVDGVLPINRTAFERGGYAGYAPGGVYVEGK